MILALLVINEEVVAKVTGPLKVKVPVPVGVVQLPAQTLPFKLKAVFVGYAVFPVWKLTPLFRLMFEPEGDENNTLADPKPPTAVIKLPFESVFVLSSPTDTVLDAIFNPVILPPFVGAWVIALPVDPPAVK